VAASIGSPNMMLGESPVPFLTNTVIVPVGLPVFFRITVSFFIELPISVDADVIISPAL